ncbi:hypothetical protein [Bacillus cereus]|uniref:hypothetical protein n=1 Tax=Bacillus cereus TaxID=1396 RepID=UPI00124EF370|nr:hypothetical protein [Bacillus cereus]KAB2477757.1 hypothetical protein F8159_17455 [Bacillus cereus]
MEALNGMENLSFEEIVKEFTPRITKCLRNTPMQEREDLEQEIKIKIYEKMDLIQNIKAPDFFEFVEKN